MDTNTPIVGKASQRLFNRPSKPAFTVMALALVVIGISACGQKGSLYLPTEAAARDRATLPQVLSPVRSSDTAPFSTPASPPAPAASSPR